MSNKNTASVYSRSESIQSLRAIAFLGIFLLHAGCPVNWSDLSVSIFFVLSGFLLVQANIDKYVDKSIKGCWLFCFNRIKKLYPLHMLTMLLVVIREFAIILYLHEDSSLFTKLLGDVLVNSLLIQSWFPPTSINCSLNGVAWYLSAMVFIYFIFPFILQFIKIINDRKRLLLVGLFIWVTQYLVSVFALYLEGSDGVIFLWLTYICPIYRLGDFIIGCIVGYVFIKSERKDISIIKASLLEILVVFTQ